jgi:hypothetical protein
MSLATHPPSAIIRSMTVRRSAGSATPPSVFERGEMTSAAADAPDRTTGESVAFAAALPPAGAPVEGTTEKVSEPGACARARFHVGGRAKS